MDKGTYWVNFDKKASLLPVSKDYSNYFLSVYIDLIDCLNPLIQSF